MPRKIDLERLQGEFIEHIWDMIEYWEKAENPTDVTPLTLRGRLEGVAFSLLTTLDGESDGMPPFALVPLGDREWSGEWLAAPKRSLGWPLHEAFYSDKHKRPKRITAGSGR